MQKTPKPLYRKVNTRARGVHHQWGSHYRYDRHTKAPEEILRKMKQDVQRGLDYTPLFRFLLSKAGQPWSEVHQEAVARLDKAEPIFWMVALSKAKATAMVRIGESSYFSGMYIDEAGILQITNPDLHAGMLAPYCRCCTHTLNGTPFGKPYAP